MNAITPVTAPMTATYPSLARTTTMEVRYTSHSDAVRHFTTGELR
jgi:hypothetical protein